MNPVLISAPLMFLTCSGSETDRPPNILVIVADDASVFGRMGPAFQKTPNFDRLSREGVLFTNAYCTNPKSSPARACLLTGRYSWQLEEAVVHRALMPEKWRFYPELLEEKGYFTGYTGKGWAPGMWTRGEYNPAGKNYDSIKLVPPFKGISNNDYCANFSHFLKQKKGKPFCFWIGTSEPHRPYQKDSYMETMLDTAIKDVPGYLPDNEIIHGDLLDYAVELEWFDRQIGKAMDILEESGELENTLIIVTADNGMPFPRAKGQIYEDGCHVSLAVRWGKKIKPGRIIHDFINFPDVAPTILEAAGLAIHPQMTGKSFLDLLQSKKAGWIDQERSFSILGRELHDPGRRDGNKVGVGYPVRAIRTKDYLYVKNYEPHRWPPGDPEFGFIECPGGPTKSYLIEASKDSMNPDFRFYELCLSFHDAEELYDIRSDKDCLFNLASNPSMQKIKADLAKTLNAELVRQEDPRVLGNGDIFDTYYYMDFPRMRKLFGDKFIVPEHLKKYENLKAVGD